jgi:flavin-binding protein dodecin
MAGTFKLIELVGTSPKSFEDAIQGAVSDASKSLRDLAWFEVLEQRGRIGNGIVSEYQVKVHVAFKVEAD